MLTLTEALRQVVQLAPPTCKVTCGVDIWHYEGDDKLVSRGPNMHAYIYYGDDQSRTIGAYGDTWEAVVEKVRNEIQTRDLAEIDAAARVASEHCVKCQCGREFEVSADELHADVDIQCGACGKFTRLSKTSGVA